MRRVQERVAEAKAQQVGLVGHALQGEPAPISLVDVPDPGGVDVTAQLVAGVRITAGAHIAVIDAADRIEHAVAKALPVLGGEQLAGPGGEARRQGQVFVRVEHQVVRYGYVEAVGVGITHGRRQKAARPLDRRIGLGKIGRIKDRQTVDLEYRVAKLDQLQHDDQSTTG